MCLYRYCHVHLRRYCSSSCGSIGVCIAIAGLRRYSHVCLHRHRWCLRIVIAVYARGDYFNASAEPLTAFDDYGFMKMETRWRNAVVQQHPKNPNSTVAFVSPRPFWQICRCCSSLFPCLCVSASLFGFAMFVCIDVSLCMCLYR